ncbi:MAG: tetratricopeptide repeat protein [Planctomycetes bacterium]|nr:tetratricopeptide repeat protein [Planctomycetota bacterium]
MVVLARFVLLATAASLVPSVQAQAPRAPSERPPEAYALACGLQQRGLHREAAAQFAGFLQSAPDHALAAEAHYRMGLCHAELGAAEPALAALREALRRSDSASRWLPECRYRLGGLLAARADHAGAEEQFSALVAAVAKDHYLAAAAQFAAGEALRELGQDAAASAAFAAAAKLAVGEQAGFRFPALYQQGFAARRSQEPGVAAQAFGAAAEAAPDAEARAECLYLRGDSRLQLCLWEAAARDFEVVLGQGGEFAAPAAFGLGFAALGRGDQNAAVAAFTRCLEQPNGGAVLPRARLELGRALHQLRRHGEAEAVLQPLLAGEVPAELRWSAQELVGLCALAEGRCEPARAALRAAREGAPVAERPRLSFALGEACSGLAQWDEALAAYQEVPATAEARLLGDALYGGCFALHQLGRFRESSAWAERLLALQPPHALAGQAAFARAENCFAQQQYAEALAAYAALPGEGAWAAEAAWKAAWCQQLTGAPAAAATAFAALSALEGPHQEEALAMVAVAQFAAGEANAALEAADRYRARFGADGAFLDRTERIAARVLQSRSDFGGAAARLRQAAARSAGAARLADQLEAAELLLQQGDYQGAAAGFAPLTDTLGSVGARAEVGAAYCAFELGDDAQCQRWLDRALAREPAGPEHAEAQALRAAWLQRGERWVAAAAAAERFLAAHGEHPKAPALRLLCGIAKARAGAHQEAAAVLAALLDAGGGPEPVRAAYELAWARRRAGDEAAALAAFARTVALGKEGELVAEAHLHLLVAALGRGDLAAAAAELPGVRGVHRGAALCQLAFAEFAAAGADPAALAPVRARCQELVALANEPLVADGLFLLALCEERLGAAVAAIPPLQRLLAEFPGHARTAAAQLLLGGCAVAAGAADAALPPLDALLGTADVPPAEAARAHLLRGRARLLRREAERAEADFARAKSLSEGALGAEAQFRIGEARLLRGDLAAAADAFVALPILYQHPEWVARGLWQAGLAYEQLQQPEPARRFFRELVERCPESAEATLARQKLGVDAPAPTPGRTGPR